MDGLAPAHSAAAGGLEGAVTLRTQAVRVLGENAAETDSLSGLLLFVALVLFAHGSPFPCLMFAVRSRLCYGRRDLQITSRRHGYVAGSVLGRPDSFGASAANRRHADVHWGVALCGERSNQSRRANSPSIASKYPTARTLCQLRTRLRPRKS